MLNRVPRVLYLVNVDTPTSIALEVGQEIYGAEVDLSVVAFQKKGREYSDNVNIPVHSIGATSFFDVYGIYDLYRWMSEYQPDVVHVHHTSSSFWGAILAKWLFGVAVVRTEHSNQRHYTVGQNILHGFAQALSDQVLCNSKDTYNNLYPLQKWFVGDGWEVVYNGVNIDRIEDASRRPSPFSEEVPSDRILVGSVGRLVDPKNYYRLIQAFSLVVGEMSGLHLVIIGDGENRRGLKNRARSEGIDDRVTFTGELPRDEVYAALHQFDLFVMPSLWEGFCNAVVEAMAAGNPIVSADISTLREVVGEVAEYVDPKDSDDIANGILKVIQEDQEKRRERGREGRRRAVENYSIDRTAEAYTQNYYEVIGRAAPTEQDSKVASQDA